MTREQQIRDLLGPADPARTTTVPPAAVTAAQLITRAEATTAATVRAGLPRRRLVLAGGAAVAAVAVTAYALPKRTAGDRDAARPPDTPLAGQVLVPIGYEFNTHPRPAGPHLRALAARIADAPHDGRTGRYAYRHTKSWSTETWSYEEFKMGFVEEEQQWTAADRSGRIRRKTLAVQFPDEASRRYWEPKVAAHPDEWIVPDEDRDIPPGGLLPRDPDDPDPAERVRPADPTRPPTKPADIAMLLRARYGAFHAGKWTMELYRSYVLSREVRAQVLLILARLDGFVWRGAATDRAGRHGVAISATFTPPPDDDDRNRYEDVLIFDPRSGELLTYEMTILTPHRRVLDYTLILPSGWTDQLG